MDFLDSSDDENDLFGGTGGETKQKEKDDNAVLAETLSLAFIALMRVKPFAKASRSVDYTLPLRPMQEIGGDSLVWTKRDVVLSRRVAVLLSPSLAVCVSATSPEMSSFLNRLRAAKFADVSLCCESEFAESDKARFDAILLLNDASSLLSLAEAPAHTHTEEREKERERIVRAERLLVPGGHCLSLSPSDLSLFDAYLWATEDVFAQTHRALPAALSLLSVRKRAVLVNETAALYWTQNTARLARERVWVERVSVPVSLAERETGVLSDASHAKAVQALTQHGVVILPGLFDTQHAQRWGAAAETDIREILRTLREKKQIDLLRTGDDEKEEDKIQRIDNFHELSMREALRCDVRNVANLSAMHAQSGYLSTANEWPLYEKKNTSSTLREAVFLDCMHIRSKNPAQPVPSAETTIDSSASQDVASVQTDNELPPKHNVRFHPALLTVLHDAMNPPGHQMGNWGRWNFEGPGPEAPTPFRVGRPGVIVSFPGCADQTIHADTSQLFVHTPLPPHYVNLFVPVKDNVRDMHTSVPVSSSAKNKEEEERLRGFAVGLTAFVVGTQDAELTERIMAHQSEEGQRELEERLIRPQLDVGDALLFDCRILHFGLANQAPVESEADGWRLMLYVNYHQGWFHDPKNWNDKEKLFG